MNRKEFIDRKVKRRGFPGGKVLWHCLKQGTKISWAELGGLAIPCWSCEHLQDCGCLGVTQALEIFPGAT